MAQSTKGKNEICWNASSILWLSSAHTYSQKNNKKLTWKQTKGKQGLTEGWPMANVHCATTCTWLPIGWDGTKRRMVFVLTWDFCFSLHFVEWRMRPSRWLPSRSWISTLRRRTFRIFSARLQRSRSLRTATRRISPVTTAASSTGPSYGLSWTMLLVEASDHW